MSKLENLKELGLYCVQNEGVKLPNSTKKLQRFWVDQAMLKSYSKLTTEMMPELVSFAVRGSYSVSPEIDFSGHTKLKRVVLWKSPFKTVTLVNCPELQSLDFKEGEMGVLSLDNKNKLDMTKVVNALKTVTKKGTIKSNAFTAEQKAALTGWTITDL